MRSREYWQKRFAAVENERNRRGKQAVQSITPHFDRAQAAIDKEIRVWYQRFADNNGISLADAKKRLTANELDELRWDIDECIKRGRENAVSGQWLKELENASAKFHISRLEALKLRTQNAAETAFAAEQNGLSAALSGTWQENYYRTAFEVQKGFSLGFDVAQVDANRVQRLLEKPWTADGQTFSDRIWKSKTQLLDSLSTELTQMCILGKAPDDAINAIAQRMNVAKNQAGRLVMTENAYFGSAAQQQCYKDLDVEKYEIVATLDSRTSEICRHLDGRVFDMKDYEPGVTAPPFHVWCRSCTVPYFEDNDENGMRAARNAEGKTYYVPAGMTYEEWQERYVNEASLQNEWQKYREIIGRNAPKTLEEFRQIKYTEGEEWRRLMENKRLFEKIDSTETYSADYKAKLKETYQYFSDAGFEFREHALNRVLGQKSGKDKITFSREELLRILNKPCNYQQPDGKHVRFYDGISVISADDTGEIVSVVVKRAARKDWIAL